MTINQLNWQQLQPNSDSYLAQFQQAEQSKSIPLMALQERLNATLSLFIQGNEATDIMLVKAPGHYKYLKLLAETARHDKHSTTQITGARYHINSDSSVIYHQATSKEDNFAAKVDCLFEEWIEPEQLFGCLRQNNNHYHLEPGLIHQVNGGILILPVKTILLQPLMWLRLKQIIKSKRFDWISHDETRPLPLSIPSMPIDIKLILLGDRLELAEFQEIEPELSNDISYSEYESLLALKTNDDVLQWCKAINTIAQQHDLPELHHTAYAELYRIAARFTGDHELLPLCPLWLAKTLLEVRPYINQDKFIQAEHITKAQANKQWRENYLAERAFDEIKQGQLQIETQGFVIGQINGLSVLEYPGHPVAVGEPSRISCVTHLGDGEIIDVERKAELGGNLHAKGVMIMQAFISSELAAEQQLPFSTSIVFEQSYGEVDGDSASLAELCALLSSLAQYPIDQQLAVTGSVDQFGNVQPIGGVNEKIEAFFDTCHHQGLTGSQGVIIPERNVRHLCLKQDVIEAVKEGKFIIYTVNHVSESIPLLTGINYLHDKEPSIISMIQERIEQIGNQNKIRLPLSFKWLTFGLFLTILFFLLILKG